MLNSYLGFVYNEEKYRGWYCAVFTILVLCGWSQRNLGCEFQKEMHFWNEVKKAYEG